MKANRFWIVIVIFCLLLTVNPGTALAYPDLLIIFSVTPTEMYNDLDATIVIDGIGLDAVDRVTLDDTQLQVVSADSTTITAVVPRGMEPGLYTLSVFSPTENATSPFTVSLGVGQWLSNGPYGGDVVQILQHPTAYSTIYSVVANMGVFRTSDQGLNWEFLFNSASPIGNLAMDAVDTALLYATRSGEGLYRSEDGGDTWDSIPILDSVGDPMPVYTVRAFTDPTIGDTVYAALIYGNRDFECMDACGIYRSTDAGDTWTRISADIPNENRIMAIAFKGSSLYAGTEDGQVYLGNDIGGGVWDWRSFSMNWTGHTPASHISKLAIQPGATSEYLFMITEGEGYSGPIYRCYDEGTMGLGCTPIDINDDGFFDNDPVMDIKFKPGNPTDILVSGYQPARSLDDGASWHFYADTSNPFQSSAVAYDGYSLTDSIFAGNLQGFYYCSSAGTQDTLDPTFKFIGTWEKRVNGISGLVPRYLEVSPSDPLSVYVNTDGSGFYHSPDGGVNWEQLPNFVDDDDNQYTLRTPIAVDPADDQHLMIATWQNTVKLSLDGGQTWADSSALDIPVGYSGLDLTGFSFYFSFIEPIPGSPDEFLAGGYFMDPVGTDYHAAPAGGIYHLTVDWSTLSTVWTNLFVDAGVGNIQGIAFDQSDPLKIYCGSYTKDTSDYPLRAELVYSLDGGATWATWSPADSGFDIYQEIRTLTVHPTNGTLLVDGGSDILMLDPVGDDWMVFSSIEGNFSPYNQLLFVPAGGGMPVTLYAASMQGLYQTTDDGNTWSYASAGLAGPNVVAIAYARIDTDLDILYTGIAGGSLALSGTSAPVNANHASYAPQVSPGFVDGGVYHLARYTYYSFLPALRK